MPQQSSIKDFFISYNHNNEQWATWIAWHLEQADYSCIIQAWDFRPGANFVLEMQQAATLAERTIAVLSPAYLESLFTAPEWAAPFADDPTGQLRKLVPVRVENCEIPGLLKQIVYIDLVGLPPGQALTKLLAGLEPGRAKPVAPPPFPGNASGETQSMQSHKQSTIPRPHVDWQPVEDALAVTWFRVSKTGSSYAGGATLEVGLVPVESAPVEARRLRDLGGSMIDLGRQAGIFMMTQAVQADVHPEGIVVRSDDRGDGMGMAVTRGGQRSAWFRLPHDSMGAVFDAKDLVPRVAAVVQLLMQIPVMKPGRFAVGAGLASISMLTEGEANVLGRRNSASMMYTGRRDIILAADQSVSSSALTASTHEVAEEVVARLELELRR